MSSFEIVTPSYRPDLELCKDLVASVQRYAPPGTRHRIIVPDRDRRLFEVVEGDNVVVSPVTTLLPRSFRKIAFRNVWVNTRAPWPPVRGWIAQQITKLAAAAASTADYVLLVDSDLAFVRPFTLDLYTDATRLDLYAKTDAVSAALPRHMVWDRVSHDLLGLPPNEAIRRPDYICWPCLWHTDTVRQLLDQVERICGMHWTSAVGRQLHFSEMVLYGVYVDSGLAGPVRRHADMHCVVHPDEIPLDRDSALAIAHSVRDDDVAVMISAKSGTTLQLRREIISVVST